MNEEDSVSNSFSKVSLYFSKEIMSSTSSSPPLPPKMQLGPLDDMSSLTLQLPLKRGLSKFYRGKSKSYNCLSEVRCLEDLAKPEYSNRKRFKSDHGKKVIKH
ncbi:hypothetical protein JRO89_XSUnG0015300 [Xanthoceras sorbifolium]|uniref:Uncharacterized protein n=1 Tax=Xanthoceras sorbifolium TaxID=99658 RepID=A0ABQ8H094_9ROSI|nr:hypothetical protein JRO89_XSUnG0015300 [Xanthoceras sorbifolium]